MIDIVALGNTDNFTPDKANQVNLTLAEYNEITRRIVLSTADRFGFGICNQILQNDDAMANITYQVMAADWRFDGRGTKEGYRKSMAIYAIRSFLVRHKKTKKKNIISYNIHNTEDSELINVLYDNDCDSFSEIDNFDELESRISKANLTDRQKDCLHKYFVEGSTLQQIAKETNITKEAVRQTILKSTQKLQRV